jgi:hypothetical protein
VMEKEIEEIEEVKELGREVWWGKEPVRSG